MQMFHRPNDDHFVLDRVLNSIGKTVHQVAAHVVVDDPPRQGSRHDSADTGLKLVGEGVAEAWHLLVVIPGCGDVFGQRLLGEALRHLRSATRARRRASDPSTSFPWPERAAARR